MSSMEFEIPWADHWTGKWRKSNRTKMILIKPNEDDFPWIHRQVSPKSDERANIHGRLSSDGVRLVRKRNGGNTRDSWKRKWRSSKTAKKPAVKPLLLPGREKKAQLRKYSRELSEHQISLAAHIQVDSSRIAKSPVADLNTHQKAMQCWWVTTSARERLQKVKEGLPVLATGENRKAALLQMRRSRSAPRKRTQQIFNLNGNDQKNQYLLRSAQGQGISKSKSARREKSPRELGSVPEGTRLRAPPPTSRKPSSSPTANNSNEESHSRLSASIRRTPYNPDTLRTLFNGTPRNLKEGSTPRAILSTPGVLKVSPNLQKAEWRQAVHESPSLSARDDRRKVRLTWPSANEGMALARIEAEARDKLMAQAAEDTELQSLMSDSRDTVPKPHVAMAQLNLGSLVSQATTDSGQRPMSENAQMSQETTFRFEISHRSGSESGLQQNTHRTATTHGVINGPEECQSSSRSMPHEKRSIRERRPSRPCSAQCFPSTQFAPMAIFRRRRPAVSGEVGRRNEILASKLKSRQQASSMKRSNSAALRFAADMARGHEPAKSWSGGSGRSTNELILLSGRSHSNSLVAAELDKKKGDRDSEVELARRRCAVASEAALALKVAMTQGETKSDIASGGERAALVAHFRKVLRVENVGVPKVPVCTLSLGPQPAHTRFQKQLSYSMSLASCVDPNIEVLRGAESAAQIRESFERNIVRDSSEKKSRMIVIPAGGTPSSIPSPEEHPGEGKSTPPSPLHKDFNIAQKYMRQTGALDTWKDNCEASTTVGNRNNSPEDVSVSANNDLRAFRTEMDLAVAEPNTLHAEDVTRSMTSGTKASKPSSASAGTKDTSMVELSPSSRAYSKPSEDPKMSPVTVRISIKPRSVKPSSVPVDIETSSMVKSPVPAPMECTSRNGAAIAHRGVKDLSVREMAIDIGEAQIPLAQPPGNANEAPPDPSPIPIEQIKNAVNGRLPFPMQPNKVKLRVQQQTRKVYLPRHLTRNLNRPATSPEFAMCNVSGGGPNRIVWKSSRPATPNDKGARVKKQPWKFVMPTMFIPRVGPFEGDRPRTANLDRKKSFDKRAGQKLKARPKALVRQNSESFENYTRDPFPKPPPRTNIEVYAQDQYPEIEPLRFSPAVKVRNLNHSAESPLAEFHARRNFDFRLPTVEHGVSVSLASMARGGEGEHDGEEERLRAGTFSNFPVQTAPQAELVSPTASIIQEYRNLGKSHASELNLAAPAVHVGETRPSDVSPAAPAGHVDESIFLREETSLHHGGSIQPQAGACQRGNRELGTDRTVTTTKSGAIPPPAIVDSFPQNIVAPSIQSETPPGSPSSPGSTGSRQVLGETVYPVDSEGKFQVGYNKARRDKNKKLHAFLASLRKPDRTERINLVEPPEDVANMKKLEVNLMILSPKIDQCYPGGKQQDLGTVEQYRAHGIPTLPCTSDQHREEAHEVVSKPVYVESRSDGCRTQIPKPEPAARGDKASKEVASPFGALPKGRIVERGGPVKISPDYDEAQISETISQVFVGERPTKTGMLINQETLSLDP